VGWASLTRYLHSVHKIRGFSIEKVRELSPTVRNLIKKLVGWQKNAGKK
jgi:hypothetical protein